MKIGSLPALFTTILSVLIVQCSTTHATGLYLDLPSHFTVVDSAKTHIRINQIYLQPDEGRISAFTGELAFRLKERIYTRMGLSYPVIQTEGEILHGVGDGFVDATLRVAGDTLDLSGLFMRAEVRVPSGSRSLRPFSFNSLDGGFGMEVRGRSALFKYVLTASYNLVGQRRKEGDFRHRNFSILGASVDLDLGIGSTLCIAGFSVNFRGGGHREVYVTMLKQRLSEDLVLALSGALEGGRDEERVFNSQLSLSLVYIFPPQEKRS